MDRSLSIVLPAFNVQASLAKRVGRLLEMLPELTTQFEVLIVDDASTDGTDEIANELSRRYPQVRTVRHPRRRGAATTLKTGLENTVSEIVIIQQQQSPLSESDLRDLWQMRNDSQLVMAQTEPARQNLPSGLIQRLVAWGSALNKSASESEGGIQMIRRQAVQQLGQPEVANTRLRIDRAERTGKVVRDESPSETRRPNLFSRIKDFAVGQ